MVMFNDSGAEQSGFGSRKIALRFGHVVGWQLFALGHEVRNDVRHAVAEVSREILD